MSNSYKLVLIIIGVFLIVVKPVNYLSKDDKNVSGNTGGGFRGSSSSNTSTSNPVYTI